MITIAELKLKPSFFVDTAMEPEQNSGVAAETNDHSIQTGIWESGPGILNLKFNWSETVYILEGFAEATNLETGATHSLSTGTIALFEKNSLWSWRIPWRIKKVYTIIDL